MAVLEVLKYPHPLLKRRSEKVERIDGETRKWIEDMTETMYHANGVGLAACQIGIPRRIIVLDVSPIDSEQDLLVMVNPEVISEEGEIDHEEGCLSVPDFRSDVKRSASLIVEALDREGKPLKIEAEEHLAIVLQHEIDHLNGILFIDRISALKRELYKRHIKKQLKQDEK